MALIGSALSAAPIVIFEVTEKLFFLSNANHFNISFFGPCEQSKRPFNEHLNERVNDFLL